MTTNARSIAWSIHQSSLNTLDFLSDKAAQSIISQVAEEIPENYEELHFRGTVIDKVVRNHALGGVLPMTWWNAFADEFFDHLHAKMEKARFYREEMKARDDEARARIARETEERREKALADARRLLEEAEASRQ